jgi:hypothetical protein
MEITKNIKQVRFDKLFNFDFHLSLSTRSLLCFQIDIDQVKQWLSEKLIVESRKYLSTITSLLLCNG